MADYTRGKPIALKRVADKKTRGTLRRSEHVFKNAAKRAEQTELLLPDSSGMVEAEGLERTFKFRQSEIRENVDLATMSKGFALDLPDLGPYSIDYTRNGRRLVLGGRKGHVATFDWQTSKLGCEFQLGETVRDVKWLHNELFFAVAQRKSVYIYDHTGMEVHQLKKHVDPHCLAFLPYHFLLASIGQQGVLHYQDTSTGAIVAEHKTRLGKCDVLRPNPHNAVLHAGHANGTVTLWSPGMTTPLVKMLAHRGPVCDLAVDRAGRYMVSAGLDGQMKVWDVRTYKCLHSYYTRLPVTSLDISDRGMLAVGSKSFVSVWKDVFGGEKQESPYLGHHQPASHMQKLRFCPFEDVLGAGHAAGFVSLIVPGAGEPNYDALETNPFQTAKQRQEAEVHALLDKIQPEMIALDPTVIGKVDRVHADVRKEEVALEYEANTGLKASKRKNKARGKNTALKRYLNRQKNVVDAKKEAIRAKHDKEVKEKARTKRSEDAKDGADFVSVEPVSAIDRFRKKKD